MEMAYIDKEKTMQEFSDFVKHSNNSDFVPAPTWNDAVGIVEDMSTADVKPVAHGKWLTTEAFPHNVYCSVCYANFAQANWGVWKDGSLPRNFCPNCGVDMREEYNDEQR